MTITIQKAPTKNANHRFFIVVAVVVTGLGTIVDQIISMPRISRSMDAAMQPMLDSTVRGLCEKSGLLNKKLSYKAEDALWLYKPISEYVFNEGFSGTLVTQSIEIKTINTLTNDGQGTKETLSIIAINPENGLRHTVTNNSPSAACLAQLKNS